MASYSAVLFLFYFNRAIAKIISVAVRAYTWHYYRVYIDVQSLQFSLLAGRVFFKGIRYHGQNETIIIQDGYITWRYWLRHVQETRIRENGDEGETDNESCLSGTHPGVRSRSTSVGSDKSSRADLPCRILMECRGAQWFVYNRSPAYDTILQHIFEEQLLQTSEPFAHDSGSSYGQNGAGDPSGTSPYQEEKTRSGSDVTNPSQDADTAFAPPRTNADSAMETSGITETPPNSFLGVLPIGIECGKGAVVIGNRNTQSILTATVDKASGRIEARSCNRADQYKQVIDFNFVHPVVQLKHNREFQHTQVEEGASLTKSEPFDEAVAKQETQRRSITEGLTRMFETATRSLRACITFQKRPKNIVHPESAKLGASADGSKAADVGVYGQERWLGLTRYLEENDEDGLIEQERWKAVEYAQFPVLVDSPEIAMTFYWDVPGLVQAHSAQCQNPSPRYEDDINGSSPPEWGVHLRFGGGTINYGPWADRQRGDLQATFFPTLFKDFQPAKRLLPGQSRVSTEMKILVDLEDHTTLRIPFREESKDWRWKGQATKLGHMDAKRKKSKTQGKGAPAKTALQGPDNRPFGWLDVNVSPNSTVKFTMDLTTRRERFDNCLELDLRGLEVSSSVNHGLLLRSQSQVISCDLGYPRQWNALRHWKIQINDEETCIFLLRDHVFLLTDLVNDWGSGPTSDFFTFVPFEYSISASFKHFKLYVNVNDNNIVDNPADIDGNTFVVIGGKECNAEVVIPMKSFRPTRNQVAFNVGIREAEFDLLAPPWNAQRTFLPRKRVAVLKELTIDGSYDYFTTTSPSLTDTLYMSLSGVSPKAELYGFFVRYLMKIKDNYFGDDIHFRTFEEYRKQTNKARYQPSESAAPEQRNRVSNDMDVILVIRAQDCSIQLPCNLYSAAQSIDLETHLISADLRITNYYMDLAVTSGPIAVSRSSRSGELAPSESSVQLFVDGLDINGHRLFGLPPSEPTYVCNWTFDIGEISGVSSVSFIHALVHAIRCFDFALDDAENALPPLSAAAIHDVTFLRASLRPVTIAVCIDQAAFMLKCKEVEVKFNDWAGARFSDRLTVAIPDVQLSVINTSNFTSTSHIDRGIATTHAYVKTSIQVGNVSQKKSFDHYRQLQQNHIALHDVRTRRTPWLIHPNTPNQTQKPLSTSAKIRLPAMCFPAMPAPLHMESTSGASLRSQSSSLASRTQSSHLSRRTNSFLTPEEDQKRNPRRQDISHHSKARAEEPNNSKLNTGRYSITVAGNYGSYSSRSSSKVDEASYSAEARSNAGRSSAGFSFSSPYKKPHFPLLALKPDMHNLPILPQDLVSDRIGEDSQTVDFDHVVSTDTEQRNHIINLHRGLQIFCTPKSLFILTAVQKTFQACSSETMLDRLQIEALTDVLHIEERNEGTSSITNLRVSCPFIGLKFVNTIESRSEASSRQECYELSLHRFVTTLRNSDLALTKNNHTPNQQFLAHCSLERLHCSASESLRGNDVKQAVISLAIHSPTLWFASGKEMSIGAQVKEIKLVSAGRKVDYVSSLVRQTLLLSEALADRFSSLAKEQDRKLRHLVFLLTRESDNVPDPPFLSATSYVLRGDLKHVRSSDSWRMISRLRYVLQELSPESREEIGKVCGEGTHSCPEDVHAKILQTFEKWRAWDLVHRRPTILMNKIFGKTDQSVSPQSKMRTPIKVSMKIEYLCILIDPGIHQNEIALKSIIIGLTLFQQDITARSQHHGEPRTTLSVVEAYLSEISLQLNWSLYELIENVVQTINLHPLSKAGEVQKASSSSQKDVITKWQFIISTEVGILNADTLSIKMRSVCQNLSMSLLFIENDAQSWNQLSSIAFSAASTSSEIRSYSKPLTLYKLRSPSIVGSRVVEAGQDATGSTWRFVGSGKEISFQVVADILEITEIVNGFVRNEVSFIASWIESLKQDAPSSSVSKSSKQSEYPKAHVTLFLDAYFISITILPALIYRIYGTGGRAAIKHGLQTALAGDIDVDVKDHAHIFTTGIDDDSEELSALQIPPISGRLTFDLGKRDATFTTRVLVEPIVFEASAIHALIDAVNRPEIVNLGKSVQQEVADIQKHVHQIFKTPEKTLRERSSSAQITLYDAYVTLASLAIHASTPDAILDDYSAELDLNMGRIQMKAANHETDSAIALLYPKLEMALDDIKLKLLRSNEVESVSCGEFGVGCSLRSSPKLNDFGKLVPSYQIRILDPTFVMYSNTASAIIAIARHLQSTLKTIEVSDEVKYLGKRGYSKLVHETPDKSASESPRPESDPISTALLNGTYSLEITNICLTWKVQKSIPMSSVRESEDLILSFAKIDLSTKKGSVARLSIQDLQVQMAPPSQLLSGRSLNSALLPEIVFNVAYLSTAESRSLAFQAKGKALDLRLTSNFLLAASDLRRSIAAGVQQVRNASSSEVEPVRDRVGQRNNIFGNRKLTSLSISADFAGAVVYIQGRDLADSQSAALRVLRGNRTPQHGRYNQFTPGDTNSSTTLRSPGMALRVEYKNPEPKKESLIAEIRVDASTNVLHPTIVPLVLEISSSVKEIVGEPSDQADGFQIRRKSTMAQTKFLEDDVLRTGDPLAIFGNCSLNLGLRICAQEFSLTCQPIARVAATARVEDTYVTVNTVRSSQHGKFFSISAAFTGLEMTVQHMYSRESSGGIRVDSIVLSLMNSKHLGDKNGISAILNASPTYVHMNAKQSQDFLLFREIWLPAEIRSDPSTPRPPQATEQQALIVQKYQQVTANEAFPWNATVSIAELNMQLDMGQSLGKSAFVISKLWTSSKKSSDSKQNLCVGFDKLHIESTGRMIGSIEVEKFRIRTSIFWPILENVHSETPLIQASVTFDHLKAKAGFDYQAFLIARITAFEFLMYNVRDGEQITRDRLIGTLDSDQVQIFCTTSSASQALALYQAFQRLIQEKQVAYEASLKEIEKFLRRKSAISPSAIREAKNRQKENEQSALFSSLKLQTNVAINLKTISVGAFPHTFFDTQVLKVEALAASARFSVVLQEDQIHSTLGLLLGELRIALAEVTRLNAPKPLGEVLVADVISTVANSHGGTILKVPRLVAEMQTWQRPDSTQIDYIFKSSFQGKIDVGWNYSRISFIRGMWTAHAQALAQRLGKPLPQSAVQITGLESENGEGREKKREQEKITAVVNVPQSKYQYKALQAPIIETPQLRDMGEATPPLEWIGLHRERLPNLTHQIVIVTLLRLAKDIDDAYSSILGSS